MLLIEREPEGKMKTKMEQFPAKNPNPVLSVAKDGTILYSNKAGEPLLLEWGAEVGAKLPSSIVDLVQRVISRNNPEKIEVKVGKKVYLIVFHPSPEEERVKVSGFDISDQKEHEEKLRIKERQNDVLHQIGKIALEYGNLQTFMDESVKLIASILDLEFCKIMELLPDGKFLMRAGTGWKSEFVGKNVVGGEKESQAGYTILSGMPVIVEDFEEDNRFNKPKILGIHGVASGASVIIGSKENIFGVLVVNSTKKRKFTSDDTYFLNSVAFLIAQVVERKNAEESLRRSEDSFRSVLENSLDMAYRRNLQADRYDYISPVVEQISGFSTQETITMSVNEVLDHIHPDERSQIASKLAQALDAGFGALEYRFKCKDGKYHWLADHFKVIKDQNGNPYFMSGVVRDITESKRAEETLAFERSQLLSIFDGMDDVVYVADLYTYEVLYANKAMKEKFGSELIGGLCYQEFQRKDSPCDFCTNQIILNERGKPCHWEYYNPNVDRFFMIMDRIIKWPDGRDVRLEIAKDITDRKRIEEALRESEGKYRELFESSVDGIIVTDLAGNILKVNPAYEKMLGYSMEELRHLSYQQLTPTRWHESEAHIVREQVFELGYSDEYEKEYIRKDGSIFPISIRVWLSIDKQGQPQGMWGIVRDITERKKIEEALLESESCRKVAEAVASERQRLFDVLETLPVMICLLTSDYHIAFANRSFRERFGESGGRHCYEYCFDHIKPCEFCEAQKVLETNKPHNWEVIIRDGSAIDVHALPFTDGDGSSMILEMKIDVTERRKAEERLRESEEKYRNIVETANEGILITDSEAIITYVNPKIIDMVGYTPEKFIGRPIWGFVSEEYRPIVKLNLEKRMQGISESYELKLIHKDGSPVWIFLNVKPLFDKDGRYIGAISMLTDITKRKEAEESLANVETARQKEIHHRIKNNLQVISSLLDLQADKFNNREYIMYSDVLEAFKESQNRVISMALIHEELHKGEGFEKLNFSSYVEELADNLLLTYRIGNDNINLNIDLDQNVFLDIDTAVPLGIIINELVSNSLKYAFPDKYDGEIRIKLHREEGSNTNLIIIISDNGVGIPENIDIESLDSLGLQLVTTLVDQLDGELELRRENGTEFTIKFIVPEKNNQASGISLN